MNKIKFYHYFSFFAYVFLIFSIIFFAIFQLYSVKPIEIFSQSYNYIKNNIIYYDSVDFKFNWGDNYRKYANKVKELKDNKEVYKYINAYYKGLEPTYIGCFDENQSIRYINKKDNYKIVDISSDEVYINIDSLWNQKTVDEIYQKLQNKKNIIIDFRGTKHGKVENWIGLFSIFLGKEIVWKEIYYSQNPDIREFSFQEVNNKYKQKRFDSIKILIDNETNSLPITFVSECLIQKLQGLNIYSNSYNYINTLSINYRELKNNLILYTPSKLFKNSQFKSIQNIDFKIYKNFILDEKYIKEYKINE